MSAFVWQFDSDAESDRSYKAALKRLRTKRLDLSLFRFQHAVTGAMYICAVGRDARRDTVKGGQLLADPPPEIVDAMEQRRRDYEPLGLLTGPLDVHYEPGTEPRIPVRPPTVE